MPHRLLLADDSVTIQRVIELTFAEEGIDVVSVGNGHEAIARLSAERFDVVLADVGMPGKDGFEVAAFVRSRPDLSSLPVVLLTGAFDPLDQVRVADVGAAAVLVKPFEPQMVIAKVRELLGGPPVTTGDDRADRPAAPPPTQRSADDYFDRLDKAFAGLNPSLEPRELRPSLPRVADGDAMASDAPPRTASLPPSDSGGVAPHGAQQSDQPSPPPAGRDRVAPGLADTFATLLAVEQGELPASALAPPPTSDDDLVDRVARRVVEQLGDRAVRELAADIVSRTAERLVREEIERIKAADPHA